MKNKNICTYLLLNTEVLKKIVWKYAEFIETGGAWKSWNHTQWLIWHHPQNHSKNLLTCSIPEPQSGFTMVLANGLPTMELKQSKDKDWVSLIVPRDRI